MYWSDDVGSTGTQSMLPDTDFEAWRMVAANADWRVKDAIDAGETWLERWYGQCDDGYICLEGAT